VALRLFALAVVAIGIAMLVAWGWQAFVVFAFFVCLVAVLGFGMSHAGGVIQGWSASKFRDAGPRDR
jgi:hypothetical protein